MFEGTREYTLGTKEKGREGRTQYTPVHDYNRTDTETGNVLNY